LKKDLKQISLSKLAYKVVVLPSYELFACSNTVKADVKLDENIKLDNLYEINAIRI